ncbi:hypothetical protein HanIR_Chr17g0889691 [Helianthus annuus]|nr:hypothetical protein HanIR_Chr17g0889691 [Helianthus annuus]
MVVLPSLRDISGPYVLLKAANEWCGLSPSLKMFPMIGSGYGPGGGGGGAATVDFRWPDLVMKV